MMRFKIWLRRLRRGLRLKCLQTRKPCILSAKAREIKQPLHASGKLSIANSYHGDPCLLACQSYFSPSQKGPAPPLPSPVVFGNSPGFASQELPCPLKDLLGFEPRDHQQTPKHKATQIIVKLGCCRRKPRLKLSNLNNSCHGNDDNTYKEDHVYKKYVNGQGTKNDGKKGYFKSSRGLWTQTCKCMEGEVDEACLIGRKELAIQQGQSTTKRKQNLAEPTPNTNVRRSHLTVMDRHGRQDSVATNRQLCHSRPVLSPKMCSALCTSQIRDNVNFQEKARMSESSSSSCGVVEKISQWISNDVLNSNREEGTASHQKKRGSILQLVESEKLLCKSEVDDPNHSSDLHSDEEESLLQVSSYESSETFSISSHSPWVNEPNDAASSSVMPCDFEIHARPSVSADNKLLSTSNKHDKTGNAGFLKSLMKKKCPEAEIIVLPCDIRKADKDEKTVDTKDACSNRIEHSPVGESLAVEKRSRNPYVDFTNSMMDMILQNQISSATELKHLLQCFLSLNPPEHHHVIIEAFTEVWDKVVRLGRSTFVSCSSLRI